MPLLDSNEFKFHSDIYYDVSMIQYKNQRLTQRCEDQIQIWLVSEKHMQNRDYFRHQHLGRVLKQRQG